MSLLKKAEGSAFQTSNDSTTSGGKATCTSLIFHSGRHRRFSRKALLDDFPSPSESAFVKETSRSGTLPDVVEEVAIPG